MLKFPSNSIQPPDYWAKRNRSARKGFVVTAAILLVIYVLVFLASELSPGFRRADVFVWLMLPDLLLSGFMGEGASGAAEQANMVGLGDRFLPLLVACLWLLAATWIGRAVVSRIAAVVGRFELLALSCLTGLSLLSTAVLLLGMAGALSRFSLFAVVLTGCAAAYWHLKRSKVEDKPSLSNSSADQRLITSQIALWLWRLVQVDRRCVSGYLSA